MRRQAFAQRLPQLWFRPRLTFSLWLLLPLSWLFRLLVGIRRGLFALGLLPTQRLPVPVVVVGNLVLGGSGKTPLVLWLVERLRQRGWKPGIISRGYGAQAARVHSVASDSPASEVGDEPLLLARRSGVPVFVGVDRAATGRALLAAHPQCNVIVSDDGLQHYRLQRNVEIAVFDCRGAGNRRLLPAGPLREPLSRLSTVTAVVMNSAPGVVLGREGGPQFAMCLGGERFYSLNDKACWCLAGDLRGKRLHAVAGIGDPRRFFAQLTSMGLEFKAHPFPDHHVYRQEDLAFAQEGALLMTEKDAVKCAALVLREAWVLPVQASLTAAADGRSLLDLIVEKIDGRPLA